MAGQATPTTPQPRPQRLDIHQNPRTPQNSNRPSGDVRTTPTTTEPTLPPTPASPSLKACHYPEEHERGVAKRKRTDSNAYDLESRCHKSPRFGVDAAIAEAVDEKLEALKSEQLAKIQQSIKNETTNRQSQIRNHTNAATKKIDGLEDQVTNLNTSILGHVNKTIRKHKNNVNKTINLQKEELSNLRKDMDARPTTNKVKGLLTKATKAREQAETARTEEIKDDMKKTGEEVKASLDRIISLEKARTSHARHIKSCKAEQAEFSKTLTKVAESNEKLDQRVSTLENKVAAKLEAPSPPSSARSLEDLTKDVQKMQESIKELNRFPKPHEDGLRGHEERLKSYKARIVELENNVKTMKGQNDTLSEKLLEVEQNNKRNSDVMNAMESMAGMIGALQEAVQASASASEVEGARVISEARYKKAERLSKEQAEDLSKLKSDLQTCKQDLKQESATLNTQLREDIEGCFEHATANLRKEVELSRNAQKTSQAAFNVQLRVWEEGLPERINKAVVPMQKTMKEDRARIEKLEDIDKRAKMDLSITQAVQPKEQVAVVTPDDLKALRNDVAAYVASVHSLNGRLDALKTSQKTLPPAVGVEEFKTFRHEVQTKHQALTEQLNSIESAQVIAQRVPAPITPAVDVEEFKTLRHEVHTIHQAMTAQLNSIESAQVIAQQVPAPIPEDVATSLRFQLETLDEKRKTIDVNLSNLRKLLATFATKDDLARLETTCCDGVNALRADSTQTFQKLKEQVNCKLAAVNVQCHQLRSSLQTVLPPAQPLPAKPPHRPANIAAPFPGFVPAANIQAGMQNAVLRYAGHAQGHAGGPVQVPVPINMPARQDMMLETLHQFQQLG